MQHGECVFALFLMYQLLVCIVDGLQKRNVKPRLKTEHTDITT